MAPKFLLVPPDLEGQALTVLLSEGQAASTNDENPCGRGQQPGGALGRGTAPGDHRGPVDGCEQLAAVADPMLYPSIGLGFRFGRTPEIFSLAQANANGGLMFTNDLMPIKVRWRRVAD